MKLSLGWGTFAAIVAYVVFGYLITVWTKSAQVEWAWGMGLTLAFIVVIGCFSNGRPDGVVIDNRNRVSLSKLQALCWTVIVLPGFAVIVAHNLGHAGVYLTATDPNLLAAMGISAASYIATPAILSTKASQDPSAASLSQTLQTMNNATGSTNSATNVGLLFARTDPKDASWRDIFVGEEIGNVTSPDLSKVQQVIITVVLLGAYGALVWKMFDTTPLTDMPKLPESLLWLMGISHAGYLAYKLVPHSTTDDKDSGGGNGGDPRQQAVG